MAIELPENLQHRLIDMHEPAYVCVDDAFQVLEFSPNLPSYGIEGLQLGMDASNEVDFLIGLDAQQAIELPIVESPNGKPINVELIPGDENTAILITDAQQQLEQQWQLQQKANENHLLLDEQKKLLSQIEQAQAKLLTKNSELEHASRLQTGFLSGVSHEFRTPLASILGYTDLLETRAESGEVDVDHIKAVQRSSKHLLTLVENLLDHGKFDANEIVINPKPIDITELFNSVEGLFKPLALAKQVEFRLILDVPETTVLLDESRLQQCLINLVGNAIKFTDQGSVAISVVQRNEQLAFEIADTGLGISAQDLAHIRKPFWQALDTGKAGTGLGLTITERIIEMMGGELEIDSQLSLGTTVKFSVDAPVMQVEFAEQSDAVSCFSSDISILLAEDDEDIAALVCLLLEEAGAQITHVANGEQALNIMQDKQFDLVLMDINMPVMDGYQVIEQLREQNNPTPIVVMTASAIDADRSRAEELNCDGYLVKPVCVTDIIGIAEQLI